MPLNNLYGGFDNNGGFTFNFEGYVPRGRCSLFDTRSVDPAVGRITYYKIGSIHIVYDIYRKTKNNNKRF